MSAGELAAIVAVAVILVAFGATVYVRALRRRQEAEFAAAIIAFESNNPVTVDVIDYVNKTTHHIKAGRKPRRPF